MRVSPRALSFLLCLPLFWACAPLPEAQAEPQPHVSEPRPKRAESKPAPAKAKPKKTVAAPKPAVKQKPIVVDAVPMEQATSTTIVPEPLPDFVDVTPPPITGQFRREDAPDKYRRPIRVGLSIERRTHQIECGESCRAVLGEDGDNTGRVPGSLTLSAQGGQIVLEGDGKFYRSNNKKALVEPWEGNTIVKLNGKSYRGGIEFAIQNGGIRVVNVVAIEDYLRGVVPNEIGRLDSTMFEALKAQAVAARTYAYKHFQSRVSQGFDVYADVRDQVYEGSDGESALANQAIDGSSGVVMQYQGGLVEAYYHSTCGGHTESVEAWNKKPMDYLKPVPDVDPQGNAWCALSSYSAWEYRYSWSELTAIAKQYLPSAAPDTIFPFNRIEKVMVLDRNPGFRVSGVLFVTDKGTFLVKGDKNRWLFRNPQNPEKTLPSAWFELFSDANGVTLKGRGFGHGIGLCQMGARALAKAGYSYKEILWHYYPNVDLVKW